MTCLYFIQLVYLRIPESKILMQMIQIILFNISLISFC